MIQEPNQIYDLQQRKKKPNFCLLPFFLIKRIQVFVNEMLTLDVIRSPLESCDSREMPLKSEPESDQNSNQDRCEEMKSNSDSESESDWDWTRIPVEDLKESDFRRRYEDDPKAFAFVCPRFQYKNKAQINLEKDIEEYKRLSRNLSPYDAIPLPLNSGLCGNTKARPTSLTYHRPLLTHLSKLALDMYNADNQVLINL